MDLQIAGRVALVTGASRGIGRAIALSLAGEGVSLHLTARGEADLRATASDAATVLGARGKVSQSTHDVATEPGARAAVRATLDAFGRIDVLVNNAGGSLGGGRFDQATAAQWRAVVDLNLMSAVWCSMAAVESMKTHGGGSIVHVNSICGREHCTSSAYTAAKSAMTGLTKEMAIDLAPYQIRVNGVAPGSVMFPGGSWDKRRQADPQRIADMISRDLPWGRFGRPEEIASVVAFLCSAQAAWVTGATIPVDGAQGRAH